MTDPQRRSVGRRPRHRIQTHAEHVVVVAVAVRAMVAVAQAALGRIQNRSFLTFRDNLAASAAATTMLTVLLRVVVLGVGVVRQIQMLLLVRRRVSSQTLLLKPQAATLACLFWLLLRLTWFRLLLPLLLLRRLHRLQPAASSFRYQMATTVFAGAAFVAATALMQQQGRQLRHRPWKIPSLSLETKA